jgi:hypothetical protein
MSDREQCEIAETLFEPSQTREEIRDAIKLEEERRAALVKNLYRLSRDRGSMQIQEGRSQRRNCDDATHCRAESQSARADRVLKLCMQGYRTFGVPHIANDGIKLSSQ